MSNIFLPREIKISIKKPMRKVSIRKMSPEEKRKHDEATLLLDEKFPHVGAMFNIFWELWIMQTNILPIIDRDLPLIGHTMKEEDKMRFNQVTDCLNRIISINDMMNVDLFNIDKESFQIFRENANQLTRLMLKITDRCGVDRSRWNFLENYIDNMPSQRLIKEQIIEHFRLK